MDSGLTSCDSTNEYPIKIRKIDNCGIFVSQSLLKINSIKYPDIVQALKALFLHLEESIWGLVTFYLQTANKETFKL